MNRKLQFRGEKVFYICEPSLFDSSMKSLIENKESFRVIERPYTNEILLNNCAPVTSKYFKGERLLGGICQDSPSLDDSFGAQQIHCLTEIHSNFIKNITPLVINGKLKRIQPINNWRKSCLFRDNWNKIEIGQRIWYFDIDNFYPTVALRLNYLSKSIYEKYIYDEFKRSRNIGLSRIRRNIKVHYYNKGKLSHTIETETTAVEIAYNNITTFAANFITHLCIKFGWATLGKDVDNVIYPADLSTIPIGKYIEAHGFDFKKYLAEKTSYNELHIFFDGRIKRYTNLI